MYVVGSRRDNCNIKKVRTVEKKFICKIINQIFFFVYLETTFIPLACLLLHFQQSCTYFHSSLANNIIVFLFPHLCSIASFSICVGFWFQFTLYCRIHILPCICFFVLLQHPRISRTVMCNVIQFASFLMFSVSNKFSPLLYH